MKNVSLYVFVKRQTNSVTRPQITEYTVAVSNTKNGLSAGWLLINQVVPSIKRITKAAVLKTAIFSSLIIRFACDAASPKSCRMAFI